MLCDENVQVNGLVFLMDFTGSTIKLQSWMGLENTRKLMDLVQVSLELENTWKLMGLLQVSLGLGNTWELMGLMQVSLRLEKTMKLVDLLQVSLAMEKTRKVMHILQKAYPARIKQINYYNTGAVFEAVFGLIRPFLSEKISNRIKIHGQSMVSVYEQIDMSVLPDEYLPDDYKGPSAGSIKDIVGQCNLIGTE
ncbi:hypothetical protein CHS0354_018186 [Potamilus streckersoni]|uniref:CRAL-TRIO domain-containing protein n=1 Tax=Potamilus streckersoni TaxID=2493646 RepID=A0AAE0TE82_9BIVA|nr:hypothetical protein CHS0354_018186 [Potamilus streckersoni]